MAENDNTPPADDGNRHCFKQGGLTHVRTLIDQATVCLHAIDAIMKGISDDDADLAAGLHFVIRELELRLNGLSTALDISDPTSLVCTKGPGNDR